jgi:hypothetical protein
MNVSLAVRNPVMAQAAMWPQGDGPRHFRSATQFLASQRRSSMGAAVATKRRNGAAKQA